MKKETAITIAIGIVLGVIVAFLVVTTTQEKKSAKKKIITPQVSPTVTIALKVEKKQPLTIESPDSDFITNKNTVTIKGQAEKDSLIIVQSAFAEKAVKNNIVSNFSLDFPLTLGENELTITAYKDSNNQKKTLQIYYLEKEP